MISMNAAAMSAGDDHRATTGFRDHVHLGNFSFDENRNYCDDDRGRRFYVDPGPRPGFDLLQGHSEFVDRGRGEDGIEIKSVDVVLQWMRDHGKELERKGILEREMDGTNRLSVAFVTRRGAVHDLFLSAHFNSRYEFLVTLHKGTYYLEQIELPRRRENPNDPEGVQMFGGKKFAQYCTSPNSAKPDATSPINDNLSYEAVMMSKCGDYRLVFSVEVHAEIQDRRWFALAARRPRHLNYVNIRTTREFNGETDVQSRNAFFRKKLFQFWSQNHIAGIPRIVLGWRDDERHVITRIETYMTDDIPSISACPWKPSRYFCAVQNLLTQITHQVTTDNARTVYHLVLDEMESAPYPLMAKKLSERRFRVAKYARSHRIVPDWFIKDVLCDKAPRQ